jgi:hypothetical protein
LFPGTKTRKKLQGYIPKMAFKALGLKNEKVIIGEVEVI